MGNLSEAQFPGFDSFFTMIEDPENLYLAALLKQFSLFLWLCHTFWGAMFSDFLVLYFKSILNTWYHQFRPTHFHPGTIIISLNILYTASPEAGKKAHSCSDWECLFFLFLSHSDCCHCNHFFPSAVLSLPLSCVSHPWSHSSLFWMNGCEMPSHRPEVWNCIPTLSTVSIL